MISYKQYVKCTNCINFLGCTEPGDVQCKKETDCLNVLHPHTAQKCKKEGWYKKDKSNEIVKWKLK